MCFGRYREGHGDAFKTINSGRMLSTQRWPFLLGSLWLSKEDELLPDQEAEGNGNSLL